MGTVVKWGLILGIGVIVWMFVMGLTGWYRNPVLLNLFFLVIPYQVLVTVLALRETARQGAGFGGQIGAGFAISSIGAILVFGGSLLFTMVAFPDYFAELRDAQETAMRQAGMAEDVIAKALSDAERAYTPMSQAIQGFIGTVITGLVTSVTAARWIRHRPEQVAAA
jgi:hypothetical protein